MTLTRRQFAISTVTAAVVHSQRSEDPAHLSLAEASRRIKAGTVNPTQLTEACLERIRAYNQKRDKIYSEPRNGTTFYVLLPATPRQGNSGRSIPTRPFCCSAVSVTPRLQAGFAIAVWPVFCGTDIRQTHWPATQRGKQRQRQHSGTGGLKISLQILQGRMRIVHSTPGSSDHR